MVHEHEKGLVATTVRSDCQSVRVRSSSKMNEVLPCARRERQSELLHAGLPPDSSSEVVKKSLARFFPHSDGIACARDMLLLDTRRGCTCGRGGTGESGGVPTGFTLVLFYSVTIECRVETGV